MNISDQLIFGTSAAFLSIAITTYGSWLVYTRKTRPHVYTVATWVIISLIVCSTMISIGEIAAAARNGALTCILSVTVVLCLRNDLNYIKTIDTLLFVLALLAIPIWLLVEHKEFSLIWLGIIEILGIMPTIRKAWTLPLELNPTIYFGTALAILCQFLSLGQYTPIVFGYFFLFFMVFFLIGSILILRRHVSFLWYSSRLREPGPYRSAVTFAETQAVAANQGQRNGPS